MSRRHVVESCVSELRQIAEGGATWQDQIPGGKADKRNPKSFDPRQLSMGIGVEVEHTNDVMLAMEIAMDHLSEDPRYYTKLKTIHKD